MRPNIMCQSAWVNVRSADWVILEENPNRIWGHTILKSFSEYLGLSLCPWILWKKQSFTSRDFAKLCYTPWNFQGQFHDHHKNFLFFLNWLLKFSHAISSIFLENPYPHRPSCPSMFGFFLEQPISGNNWERKLSIFFV